MKLGPNQLTWIKSLESGEFTQGRGRLQEGDTYCCLGVACIVAGRLGVEIDTEPDGSLRGGELDDYPDVRKWLALPSVCGVPSSIERECREYAQELSGSDVACAALTDLNDGDLCGMGSLTHPQIAAVLRRFPEAYFSEPK